MLYEFKLNHDVMGETKSICCVKGESGVDHRIETELWEDIIGLKKFRSVG